MNKALGYYTAGDQAFASKARCLLYATENQLPVEWVFNNNVFGAYDFSHEPESSLDSLYDRRARELRERYDYVILSYSGGADGHNILMAFHRQGLHIDEIITNWIFEASKTEFLVIDPAITESWNQNAEYELTVKDKMQWIADNMPKTKVTIYDSSKDILTYYLKARDASWVLDSRDVINPSGHQRFNYYHVKELRSRIDRKQNIGIILGIDKPPCIIVDGKLYLRFIDKPAGSININPNFGEYDNSTIEFFYWSPDACDMLAKQCHTFLRFIQANPRCQLIWSGHNSIFKTAKEKILRGVVYQTTWDNSWFQVDKPQSDWDCEFDTWFYNSKPFSRARDVWAQGADYLAKNIAPEFLNGRGTITKLGPRYYVGDI